MSRFVVGLTGGIGSGKTTVANMFAQFGVELIDADIIAREIVMPGELAHQKIVERFGNDILNPDRSLNRAKLRQIIFSCAEDKLWLNQLTHPLIRQQMLLKCQNALTDYCLLIIPLLFENQLEYLTNRILVVDCSEHTQIERASLRDNNSVAQIQAIISAQISRKIRLDKADDIINTENSLSEIRDKCSELHQFYIKLAKT